MAKIDPEEMCPCDSGLFYKDCHFKKIRKIERPSINELLKLKVIPEPLHNTRAVFIFTGEGSVCFSGNSSSIAMVCGKCSAHLTEGISPEQINNVVIKCNLCGSFNDTSFLHSNHIR